jgi:hypothetical protein
MATNTYELVIIQPTRAPTAMHRDYVVSLNICSKNIPLLKLLFATSAMLAKCSTVVLA